MRRPVMSDADYTRVRRLLAATAGLVFDEARRESMAFSLAERMEQAGSRDVAAYLALAETDPLERQQLLDEVTIQETHFFRNPPQVRALARYVLPDLLRHAEANGRRLRIWSAGCSTGEEPYTIAMLLRELLPTTAGWDVRIVATDLSQRAVDAARAATYGPRAVQLATPAQLSRFFVAAPDGGHAVRQEVRALVDVRRHNLVADAVPFGPQEPVDLVLCRNVTIYFARETTRALMSRLHACLREGGYLFLGHSETLWQVSDAFRLTALGDAGQPQAFVYRRPAPGAPVAAQFPAQVAAQVPSQVQAAPPSRRPAPAAARRAQAQAGAPAPAPPGPDVAGVRGALAQGRYADAAELATGVLAGEPMLAEAHYLRGLALVNAGRDADALVDLRKAVYLEPQRGLAHFLLAGVLDRLGDAAAGAREYRAAGATLGASASDATAAELGGRSVGELAALCRRLGGDLVDGPAGRARS